jgi:hypothetical protein
MGMMQGISTGGDKEFSDCVDNGGRLREAHGIQGNTLQPGRATGQLSV